MNSISVGDLLPIILRRRSIYDTLKNYWLTGAFDQESYRIQGGTKEYLAIYNNLAQNIKDEFHLRRFLSLHDWDIQDIIKITTPLHIQLLPFFTFVIPYDFCIDDTEEYNTDTG